MLRFKYEMNMMKKKNKKKMKASRGSEEKI